MIEVHFKILKSYTAWLLKKWDTPQTKSNFQYIQEAAYDWNIDFMNILFKDNCAFLGILLN